MDSATSLVVSTPYSLGSRLIAMLSNYSSRQYCYQARFSLQVPDACSVHDYCDDS